MFLARVSPTALPSRPTRTCGSPCAVSFPPISPLRACVYDACVGWVFPRCAHHLLPFPALPCPALSFFVVCCRLAGGRSAAHLWWWRPLLVLRRGRRIRQRGPCWASHVHVSRPGAASPGHCVRPVSGASPVVGSWVTALSPPPPAVLVLLCIWGVCGVCVALYLCVLFCRL